VNGGLSFASVSADYDGTCAVTTAGVGYCWGNASSGNLGVGSGQASILTTPRAVLGGLQFASLSLDLNNGCGLTTAHVAYCWGQGGSMLGIGSDGSRVGIAAAPMKVGLQP
jgi:alpha-tubulin suppressor-like RCC1 family protein